MDFGTDSVLVGAMTGVSWLVLGQYKCFGQALLPDGVEGKLEVSQRRVLDGQAVIVPRQDLILEEIHRIIRNSTVELTN